MFGKAMQWEEMITIISIIIRTEEIGSYCHQIWRRDYPKFKFKFALGWCVVLVAAVDKDSISLLFIIVPSLSNIKQ